MLLDCLKKRITKCETWFQYRSRIQLKLNKLNRTALSYAQ